MEALAKLKELERVRKVELEARVEKERIKRRLAGLDREHLQVLEQEKQKEVEQLARERETILRKEEELRGQIQELEQKLQRSRAVDEATAAGKTTVTAPLASEETGTLLGKLRRKAREQGERSATLKVKKQELEERRQAIQAALKEKGASQQTDSGARSDRRGWRRQAIDGLSCEGMHFRPRHVLQDDRCQHCGR